MSNLSIMPVRALFDCRMNQEDILLLGVLCTHTDHDGICYPGLERLSSIFSPLVGREKNYDPTTISKRIDRLMQFGYVQDRGQRTTDNGSYKSRKYKVLYDTALPSEFDRRKIHTPSEFASVEIHTSSENSLGEIHANVPIERPNGTLVGAENAPTTAEDRNPDTRKDEITFPPVEPRQPRTVEQVRAGIAEAMSIYTETGGKPAVANPRAAKKEYVRQAASVLASVMGHMREGEGGGSEPSDIDRSAAGRLFDKGIPLQRVVEFCAASASNGKGQRYRTTTDKDGNPLNAYHVAYDVVEWKANGYKPLTQKKEEFSAWRMA